MPNEAAKGSNSSEVFAKSSVLEGGEEEKYRPVTLSWCDFESFSVAEGVTREEKEGSSIPAFALSGNAWKDDVE